MSQRLGPTLFGPPLVKSWQALHLVAIFSPAAGSAFFRRSGSEAGVAAVCVLEGAAPVLDAPLAVACGCPEAADGAAPAACFFAASTAAASGKGTGESDFV